MTVRVVWLNYHPDVCNTPGMWDQAQVTELLFPLGRWHPLHPDAWPDEPAAVVVIPGAFHAGDVARINADLARFERVLVVITSDEGSRFPYEDLQHPAMRLWVATPRPGRGSFDRAVPDGWQPDTRDVLVRFDGPGPRPEPWAFFGRVNHPGREAMARALTALEVPLAPTPARFLRSAGFTQGVDQATYLRSLRDAKLAIAPAGPETPDSFRCYEGLEAGCLPLVDVTCPAYPDENYWSNAFGEQPPFWFISDWEHAPGLIADALAGWPANANRASAWWQNWKREWRRDWETTAVWLGTELPDRPVTVLMPTSPIPSHPSISVVDRTIRSVRNQLPDAEILLLIDGIRAEQEERRPAYDEYVRRVLWAAAHQWDNVSPVLFDDHQHQTGMTRRALDLVDTDLVLFVEHDTPLEDMPIPWDQAIGALRDGEIDLLRFHHESEVLDVHRHLMVGGPTKARSGLPMWPTVQWSQRPHLASVAYYRRILDAHFSADAKAMIEDRMHGVVQSAYQTDRRHGWYQHRLAIFHPDGNIRRSFHLDGRASDPKYDMRF